MKRSSSSPFRQTLSWFRQLDLGNSRTVCVLAGAVVAIVASSAVVTSAAPIALKALVDNITSTQSTSVAETSMALAAAYVGALAGGRMLTEVQSLIFGNLDQSVQSQIRSVLIKHIFELPFETQLDLGVGKSVQSINNAIRGVSMLISTSLLGLAPIIAQFLTIAFVLSIYCNIVFVSIFIASAVIYAYVFAKGAYKINKLQKEAAVASSILNGALTDSLSHAETIKYLSAEPAVVERVAILAGDLEANARKFHTFRTLNGLAVSSIFFLTLGTTIALSFVEVANKTLTIGEFVLINTYVLQIIRPLEFVGIMYREMNQALAMTAEVQTMYRYPTEKFEFNNESRVPDHGRVQFRNVTFVYPTRKSTLSDVSFEVSRGARLAIVGASGSGKSTIARLLAGIYSDYEGDILLDGISLRDLPMRTLRSAVFIVSQDTALFDATIEFNMGIGTAATTSEIENVLGSVGLGTLINELPQGLNTIIGQRGLKLSAGQRQRIGFARAALRRPKVLVLDEVTSSLDATSERELLNMAAQLFPEITTISIAHRLRSIMAADYIIVMDNGRIVASGVHTELLKAGGIYAEMWNLQHEETEESGQPLTLS